VKQQAATTRMEVLMRFTGGVLALIVTSAAIAAASIVIPFSGSGASGTIPPGEA